jgi:hypothetical protein
MVKAPARLAKLIRLTAFWPEWMGVSAATGKKIVRRDPDFPKDELVLVGLNSYAIPEDAAARYQDICRRRAQKPRPIPVGLRNPRAGAAASVAARRAKAKRTSAR